MPGICLLSWVLKAGPTKNRNTKDCDCGPGVGPAKGILDPGPSTIEPEVAIRVGN